MIESNLSDVRRITNNYILLLILLIMMAVNMIAIWMTYFILFDNDSDLRIIFKNLEVKQSYGV